VARLKPVCKWGSSSVAEYHRKRRLPVAARRSRTQCACFTFGFYLQICKVGCHGRL